MSDDDTIFKRGPGRPSKDEIAARNDATAKALEAAMSDRPPLRDDIRPASLTASERAAEIRAHLSGTEGDQDDKFFIDRNFIPEGFTWQWKRETVYGKDDPSYMSGLLRKGWRPVDCTRYPGLMPAGYAGPVTREGQLLMEIPTEIVEEYYRRDRREAHNQVATKEAQLNSGDTPQGTMERTTDPRIHKIRKSMVPYVPPATDGAQGSPADA